MTNDSDEQVEIVYCVRGCASPCGCGYCAMMSVPLHSPILDQAVDGLLCWRCRVRLHDMIEQIFDMYRGMTYELVKRGGDSEGGGGERLKGSPALINLDAFTLIDARTMYEPTRRDDGSISSGPIDISAALTGWAASLRDSLAGDEINSGDLYGRWADLIELFDELVCQPWIDDCFVELADMHRLLCRATGVERSRPIGQCVTTWPAHWLRKDRTDPCGHPVFAQSGAVQAMCSRCGTRYRGMELIRMQLQQKGIE